MCYMQEIKSYQYFEGLELDISSSFSCNDYKDLINVLARSEVGLKVSFWEINIFFLIC